MRLLGRFGIALLVGVSMVTILSGCNKGESGKRSAPSPSNSGGLSKEELSLLLPRAENGDTEAMYKLAINYLFFEQNDEQGWIWMERSAEAGNADARTSVLDHYANQDSPEKREYGVSLKRKWKL